VTGRTPSWKRSWAALVLVFFGVIYACSLTLVYVEGDDAESIAYHALGRNAEWQRSFSAYQGGADLLLRLLPANESVLRVVAISVTSLSMVAFVLLMFVLVFDMLGSMAPSKRTLAAVVVMLAIPEVFYLGLVYHPAVIGMALALAAHVLLRRALRQHEEAGTWSARTTMLAVMAVFLLGAGAAIRWTLVMYGWVILWDWVLGIGRKPSGDRGVYVRRFTQACVWGFGAAVAWWLAVVASGYSLADILAYPSFAREWMAYAYDWRVVLAQGLSVFTPALVVLGICGIAVFVQKDRRLAGFVIATLAPVLLLITWSDPKQYLWAFPSLVLCVMAGWHALITWTAGSKQRRTVQVGLVILVLLPWGVGVRTVQGDTAWGPHFEVRPYDRPHPEESGLSVALGSGAAVPTPEGPRPLWGHASVLLGGEWRAFNVKAAQEHTRIVEAATAGRLPILVLQGTTGFLVCELARQGFGSVAIVPGPVHVASQIRRFSNHNGQSVALMKIYAHLPELIRDEGRLREIVEAVSSEEVIATGYPEDLRLLFKFAPQAMRMIGPGSAVVSLARLRAGAMAR